MLVLPKLFVRDPKQLGSTRGESVRLFNSGSSVEADLLDVDGIASTARAVPRRSLLRR